MENQNSSLTKYASLSLILGPFIEPYAISDGGTALYKLFMLFNIFLFWYKGNRSLYMTTRYKIFFIYALTIPTIIAVLSGYTTGIIGSYFAIILFSLNMFLVVPVANTEYIIKYYRIAVVICIGVFVAQEVAFIKTGSRFMALIPFLHPIYAGVDISSFVARMSNEGRSCSLFLEPSHFAHFLLPYLAIVLGELHDKRKLFNKEALILSIVLLFLRSGNGLLVMAIIWVVAILFSSIKRAVKYMMIIPLSLFVAVYGFSAFSNTEMGQSIVERTEELNTDITEVNSGFIRVWRGYYVFEDQPSVVKLLGVGYGGVGDAVHNSRNQWMFASNNDIYVNNIQAFLISYGIIGSFLYLLFLYEILSKRRFAASLLVLTFFSLCFLDNFFCSTKMLLMVAIPLVINNDKCTTT